MEHGAFRKPVGAFNAAISARRPYEKAVLGPSFVPDDGTWGQWQRALDEVQILHAPEVRCPEDLDQSDSPAVQAGKAIYGVVSAIAGTVPGGPASFFFVQDRASVTPRIPALPDSEGVVRMYAWDILNARRDFGNRQTSLGVSGSPGSAGYVIRASLYELRGKAVEDARMGTFDVGGGVLRLTRPVLLLSDRVSPVTGADFCGEMGVADWMWDEDDGLELTPSLVILPKKPGMGDRSAAAHRRASTIQYWLSCLWARRRALYFGGGLASSDTPAQQSMSWFMDPPDTGLGGAVRSPVPAYPGNGPSWAYTGLVRPTILWTALGTDSELYATLPGPGAVDAGCPGSIHAVVHSMLQERTVSPVRHLLGDADSPALFVAIPKVLPRAWGG